MSPRRPAIEVRNLTVRYGGFTAVDKISFTIQPGEIIGFLGANGAGKTTTIRVLCGLRRATSGKVVVAGQDAAGDLVEIKRRVGYMSQRFTLYDDLTVMQNLEFAAALRRIDEATLQVRAKALIEIVQFSHPLTTRVSHLSGGLRQEVSLIAAMIHDPEVLFLDEPTAGVSPGARVRFWALIRKIAGSGKTVFVTTHHIDEAEQCGRIALMSDGKLIALDTPENVKRMAFAEPFFALRPEAGAPEGWISRVRSDPSVFQVTCHGLNWHLGVRNLEGFKKVMLELGSSVRWTPIQPSLEDAFIRLIQKGAR